MAVVHGINGMGRRNRHFLEIRTLTKRVLTNCFDFGFHANHLWVENGEGMQVYKDWTTVTAMPPKPPRKVH